jgi:hypothetical protein
MATTQTSPRRRGRPPGGIRAGERLRDYPTVTLRVPPQTRAMLRALCRRKRLPAWLMFRLLVLCFVRGMPARERRWVIAQTKQAA